MMRQRQRVAANDLHPGIMGKIMPNAGIAGLFSALSSTAVFLIGIPWLCWFLAGAFVLGGGIALLLQRAR